MQLVDSHCHLNFDPLGAHLDQVLDRARDHDVGYMLCVSVNLEDFPQVRALAQHYDQVFASVGVHPNEREGREPEVKELVALGRGAEIVAVGETGLDYYRSTGELDWQRERFARHIQAAKDLKKPLIVHSRDADTETVDLLHSEGAGEAGGVLHCFADRWEIAKRALDLGFYISFSGIVTFKNAADLREVARKVPTERILIETDAPYLAPTPHRGKANEPAYVRYVAKCLATIRNESFKEIAQQTTDNFFTLFKQAAVLFAAKNGDKTRNVIH